MDWQMLAAIAAIVLIPNGFILWMMSKLDNDIRSIGNRMDAQNVRIDAMGARIDATQGIIMRMLEKQGR